jgi:hypothetical protein
MTNIQNVHIEIGHQAARITPEAVYGLLARDLSTLGYQFAATGCLGYEMRRRRQVLVRNYGRGGLAVRSGLVPLVRQILSEAGLEVTIEDRRRFPPCLQPSKEVLEQRWYPGDRRFLEALATEPRGLIADRSGSELHEMIARICEVYPSSRVMVAWNASRRRLAVLRRYLRAAAGDPFHGPRTYPWPLEGGRLVCSLLQFDNLNTLDFDMVIFLDALQGLSPAHGPALARLRSQRLYGFIPAQICMNRGTWLRLQAVFGPLLYPRRGTPGGRPEVAVHWLIPPWAPPAGSVSDLERKRLLYWHNGPRNDLIAAVAAACSNFDASALEARGLFLAEAGLRPAVRRAVTILVESTEHGLELLGRLPEWRLVSAAPASGTGPAPPQFCIGAPPLHRAIVTCHAAASLNSFEPDVLICAGPEWASQAVGRYPGWCPTAWSRVALVDLADDYDGAARAAARRRLRDYAAQGWRSPGAWARLTCQEDRPERADRRSGRRR